MLADVDTFDKLVEGLEEDLRCQARHTARNTERCSVEVVALFYCCARERVMVCQEAVDVAEARRHTNRLSCHSSIADCWRFIYI